jgi:response regulator RpfG family c-di-GMP phosphodiesterase
MIAHATVPTPTTVAALAASWSPPAAAPEPGRTSVAPERVRLLVVDDEETIRLALVKFLRLRGYEVRSAGSGVEALALLAAGPYEAMLCDVRMPGMSWLDLVPHAIAACPDLAVMMLTAVNDAATATQALTRGALDYVTKPVELGDLQLAVERALARRAAAVERKALDRRIREEVLARTAELEREKAALKQLTVSIVETLINAQEAKDVYLRGHSQRVADLGAQVAAELGLDDDVVEDIRLAGRLHDVGKIGIREEVLNKPGRLAPEEFEHVKDHVRVGTEILAPLRHIIGPALQYVQDHHEHWDGNGYPRGLAGEAISLGGRILCACDAFDALTSRRPYREPLTTAATLDFLASESGRQVDPLVLAALHAVVERQQTLIFIDERHG